VKTSPMVAYGECGHSYSGCTCPNFVYDPDLSRQKDDDAREAAEELLVDLARDHQAKDDR
jgi:hypothetical protein